MLKSVNMGDKKSALIYYNQRTEKTSPIKAITLEKPDNYVLLRIEFSSNIITSMFYKMALKIDESSNDLTYDINTDKNTFFIRANSSKYLDDIKRILNNAICISHKDDQSIMTHYMVDKFPKKILTQKNIIKNKSYTKQFDQNKLNSEKIIDEIKTNKPDNKETNKNNCKANLK